MVTLLVADDNTNIQKMVALAFEDRGIKVVSVGNGEAAVRRMPDLNPDLVLADIFMPVRNGYEVCEFVKKDQRFAHVPVILLVGAFDPLDEKEARRVGADGVLKKPFVPPDPLVAMVMAALEKNPRVVAELAQAKAALEPHGLPEPPGPANDHIAFQPVAAHKVEVKPLPEFPEPSPEEAALIYGFGQGKRAVTSEQLEGLQESPAPVPEANKEEEEEFEGASTTRDWRRDSAEFEVPAGAAQAVAPPEETLEPVILPKEDPIIPIAPKKIAAAEAETKQEIAPVASVEEEKPQEIPVAPAPVIPTTPPVVAQVPVPEGPVVTLGVESEPQAPASSPTHWMDAIASSVSASKHTIGGWLAALSKPSVEETKPAPELSAPAPEVAVAIDPPVAVESPAPQDAMEVEAPTSQAELPAPQVVEAASNDSFFAEEPPALVETAMTPEPTAEIEIKAQEPEPIPLAVDPPAPEWEPLNEPADATPSLRDPNLVEPPAVSVTPEPLLVDEGSHESHGYGSASEELGAPYTFMAQAAAHSGSAADDEPSSQPEPQDSAFDERIPTIPPPNREALAEIPFLRVPPGFDPNASAPAAPDQATVDAIVQRLVEKLEPQLHELLSQGVLKPLVESVLQGELAKKQK